jgi:hypothetical protein
MTERRLIRQQPDIGARETERGVGLRHPSEAPVEVLEAGADVRKPGGELAAVRGDGGPDLGPHRIDRGLRRGALTGDHLAESLGDFVLQRGDPRVDDGRDPRRLGRPIAALGSLRSPLTRTRPSWGTPKSLPSLLRRSARSASRAFVSATLAIVSHARRRTYRGLGHPCPYRASSPRDAVDDLHQAGRSHHPTDGQNKLQRAFSG